MTSLGSFTSVRRDVDLGGSNRGMSGTSTPLSAAALRIADNAFLKCCRRCGGTYETKTRRQPVMKLCGDCKFVLSPEERRGYMDRTVRA